MHRHRAFAHRLVAGMLALWFAFVAAGGARAHACAMHAAVVGAAATAPTPAAGARASHAAHGGEHQARAGTDTAGHHHDGGGSHRCTCPDTSCGSSVMAIAAPRLVTHFGIPVADVRAVFAPAVDHRLTAVPHLRPFANGPPAAALA